MTDALSRSPDYRVLRRLLPPTPLTPPVGQNTKTAVLLDTETTGLDARKDEIIELGMVKFDYLSDGRVAGVRDTFSTFNEPSVPIPFEVTALTRHHRRDGRWAPDRRSGRDGIRRRCGDRDRSQFRIRHEVVRPIGKIGGLNPFSCRYRPILTSSSSLRLPFPAGSGVNCEPNFIPYRYLGSDN
ncbi:DNA polymerase III epsilon subunit-like protein [Bradyrhizobium sp. i1.8.4]|uniref:exonuclease domain-containing protein n=1 Tax=unclassified Bradyrhizobium TaxID=2631580 RepID=UPI003D19D7EE